MAHADRTVTADVVGVLADAAAPEAPAADLELVGRRTTTWRGAAASADAPTSRPAQRSEALAATAAAAGSRLRANLRDEIVRFLLGALFVAQVADLWTTHVALGGSALMERNPLFRPLFQALPGLADGVKLGAVMLLALVALSALPLPRSRHALLLAAAISIIAPISNLMVLSGRI